LQVHALAHLKDGFCPHHKVQGGAAVLKVIMIMVQKKISQFTSATDTFDLSSIG
jgi:hypothetical protein